MKKKKKKWNKEKKRIEGEVEKQRNIIMHKRKLTNEIAMFKNRIKELEENLEKEKKEHRILVEKLKKKIDNLKIENEKIKTELKISNEYRNKLEVYQQNTIMKLATTVNKKKNQKYKSKNFLNTSSESSIQEEIYNNSNNNNNNNNSIDNSDIIDNHHYAKNKSHDTKKINKFDIDKSLLDSSDNSDEIKKIINHKKNNIHKDLEIIYNSSTNTDDGIYNNKIKNNIKIKSNNNNNNNNMNLKNNKNKFTLDKLFIQNKKDKDSYKNSDNNKIDEEYINKNLKRMRSIIKNKKKYLEDKMSNHENDDTCSLLTTTNEINLNDKEVFFYENCKKNKDKISFNDDINYANNKSNIKYDKRTSNKEGGDIIYENMNKKKNKGSTLNDNNNNNKIMKPSLVNNTNEIYMSDLNTNEHNETSYKPHRNYSTSNQKGKDDIINNKILSKKKTNSTDSYNKNNNIGNDNILKPFGKDWDFVINFDFDELFNQCENVIESIFSSSKKIKYRQAFIDGKVETLFDDGLKLIEKNRNKKIMHPSNITIYLYPTKDYKAHFPNSYMLFRFVNKGIYQVNIPNKCQLNKFPSGQVDCKYTDGHIQILFCDGKRKEILPNREEYVILRNGKILKLI
ncbi:hypothetical protein PFDG_02768 [Plasmodium falciparum Dd2]|uniref:Spindle assembly abnormal protein 4 n=1 Tax=Plasmodium falciparum (isolate Dd2) TaxID=57267 RepID=A0A0L7M2U8_PLAF4|nr:hypothetical protein PFDG_02768 [Plasmodium falciparum Dd2]